MHGVIFLFEEVGGMRQFLGRALKLGQTWGAELEHATGPTTAARTE